MGLLIMLIIAVHLILALLMLSCKENITIYGNSKVDVWQSTALIDLDTEVVVSWSLIYY
jgi:hypothetical protein